MAATSTEANAFYTELQGILTKVLREVAAVQLARLNDAVRLQLQI
jgi:hypothetical protein